MKRYTLKIWEETCRKQTSDETIIESNTLKDISKEMYETYGIDTDMIEWAMGIDGFSYAEILNDDPDGDHVRWYEISIN